MTTVRATVRASWSGGPVVRVGMDEAGLEWTLRLRSSPLARLANARPSRVSLEVHGEEHPLRVLLRVGGTGEDSPAGPVADGAGPRAVVHPHRLLVVGAAHAELGGRELGRPASTREPLLGGLFPWRAPGILVEGEMWTRVPEAATTSPGIGIDWRAG